jgi:signal transduction histidine kinase/ligand-binding sensor domain-containing protein
LRLAVNARIADLKRKFLYTLIPFIGTLIACRTAYSQQPYSRWGSDSLIFSSLTEEDGLSDNKVNCFFQDSKGFMWIGTADGLNRYDGSLFRVYRTKSRIDGGLADNEISAITEDPAGQLWIATNRGLSSYDPVTDSFHTYRVNDQDFNRNLVTDVVVDTAGMIWAATYKGLLCFNPRTMQFTTFTNHCIPSGAMYGRANRILKLCIDKEKRFWLCTHNGVWRFFPSEGRFEQYIGGKDLPTGEPFVRTIFEDGDGRLWLGCFADGLLLFDPGKRTVKDVFGLDKKTWMLPSITAIRDGEGHYTLNAGLYQADPVSGASQVIYRPGSTADVFDLRAVYVSNDNLLWWGTDKGIRVADPIRRRFRHVAVSTRGITSQGVSLLAKGNSFYIGGQGNEFLKIYDSAFHLARVILSDPKLPALLNIVREDEHRLWLCTEAGVYLFDERTAAYREFHARKGDTTQPAMDFMTNMFIDSKGHRWIFPWRSGIWQIDGRTGKFTRMFTGWLRENDEPKKLLISAAVEDSLGRIWFADLDEGLICYDPRTGVFSKPTEKAFGSKYALTSVVLDKDILWGVTTGKVFSVNTATGATRHWDVPDEYNTDVHGFCGDRLGNLWITTRKGLLCFNKETHYFHRWTKQDGLRDNDLTESLWTLPDGEILYTSFSYFTAWDPGGLLKPDRPVPVLLTAVYSQNQRIPVQEDGKMKRIELDHSYNHFTFNWAVQNYRDPLHNQYYYKLDGVDTGWKYAGNKGIIQYGGLLPGRYTFHMRGAGGNGILEEADDELFIVIHPPFWKTAWFLVLAGLGLLTAVVIVVRYIAQRNLREKILRLEKEQAIDRERNRISQDMHDGLGSGLTKIAIMSEVVKQQLQEPEKARRGLEGIAESSRELVDNLQDIIWILNPQNDTIESLAAYIREYALQYFEPFGIAVKFRYPDRFPDLKFSEGTRRNIFLTVKESFHNTCKHAWCNTVQISIAYREGFVTLDIRDDGKGFDPEKVRKFGNGLINMQHRMQEVGGRCDISSDPGKGTCIIIGVPA